jgi:hypothetical protein
MHRKSRTNLFLTLSLFTVVTALATSSFYLWYTQAQAHVQGAATAITDSASGFSSADTGTQFWTTVVAWFKTLWPRLIVFTDNVYDYLMKLAYHYKLNLLWKYRHKITVLSIVGLVLTLLVLVLLGLWITYIIGKRRGHKDAQAKAPEDKKKR